MMDDILSLKRRGFLQQTAGAIAVTAVGTVHANAGETHSLVVYRADDAASRAFAEAMQAKGARVVALGNDVVRQWRNELQSLVVEQRYQLLGRTAYPDWFLLRGLAAEHRLFPQHEQQPSAASFEWIIQEHTA